MTLDREAIRAAQDRRLEEVEVPEWGGSLYFGSLLLGQRNRLIERFAALDENNVDEGMDAQLDLLIAVACDGDGKPILTSEDKELLLGKDPEVVEGLVKLAMDFLGMTQRAHEETVGNSRSTPSEPSSSDSPES